MKILLDTHTFLWWITDDQKLSGRAREIISDGSNELFLSAATGWEIAIKVQIGRLKLPEEPIRFILEQMRINAIQSLPIQMNHALHVSTLPQHHRDPFDRLLIAQAQLEGLPVLSSDHQLANYQVEVIW
jgi:PIN domain nuclease of toxin-antitoxin system